MRVAAPVTFQPLRDAQRTNKSWETHMHLKMNAQKIAVAYN